MNCRHCGKNYHHCSSCGQCFPEEIGYCSYNCWESSDEYIEKENRFENFIDTLTNSQLKDLRWLIHDIYLDVYEGLFVGMIDSKFKEN